MTFWQEVERRIEANTGNGGWAKGPEFVCENMLEEAADIVGWMRGLDQHPMTAEQLDLTEEIKTEAALLWLKVGRLKATYRV